MDLGFLVYLACPVGMGLMMWMMMRGQSSRASGTDATREVTSLTTPPRAVEEPRSPYSGDAQPGRAVQPARSNFLQIAGICFDWRVIGGLVAVGLAVVVLAPGLVGGVLPLLLVAACPLSMLLMMRGKHANRTDAEAAVGSRTPLGDDLGPEHRLAELRAELATAQAWQNDLTREMADLEQGLVSTRREPSGSAPPTNGHATQVR